MTLAFPSPLFCVSLTILALPTIKSSIVTLIIGQENAWFTSFNMDEGKEEGEEKAGYDAERSQGPRVSTTAKPPSGFDFD